MRRLSHSSAKPSLYDKESKTYDAFNEENSKTINESIEKLLRKYKRKSVLDLTCGTGSQVFWLAKKGYEVIGADINSKMLKIAKSKAKQQKLEIEFFKSDMRTANIGKFDAVITIFNAVGHLTKSDFEQTIRTVSNNLQPDGLYIFDIFNAQYFQKDNNITKLTIDWQKKDRNSTSRIIQYSTINESGVLSSFTTEILQKNSEPLKVRKYAITLQIYSSDELKEMLHRNGFKVIKKCAIDGSRFDENKTDRILMVAKKI
ncbi:MAG TPA: methyltransferase domain-containing protein [Candidatus Babeliales bacterium]|nr:methyltransferase domain-containing protein [Candidatus Babeliales bacterium]